MISASFSGLLRSVLRQVRVCLPALVLVLSPFFGSETHASGQSDEVKTQLKKALSLALHEEEDAALEIYLGLLDDGEDGAKLRYNIGTLYLTKEELGPAVFHLATALQYAPNDDDTAFNLRTALAMRRDRVSELGAEQNPLSSLARSLSREVVAGIFVILVSLLLLCFAFFPILTSSSQKAVFRIGMLLGVFLFPAGLLLGSRMWLEQQIRAVVWVEKTTARVGPDETTKSAFVAHGGLLGTLQDEEGDFSRLRLDNGLDAWIPTSALKKLPKYK
ncbi:MAG: hypothetical protein GY822_08890 [Deltaproteobacteria bacterium]|nr:hypothetical protein [Deltaproteobacteria bacterium]